MRVLTFSIVVLACVSVIRAASPPRQPNSVTKALLWQARQYTYIKTIHFLAADHFTTRSVRGKKVVGKIHYEYWGAGIKYRIEYQQFIPHAVFDVVVTDNGKHFRLFDRISDFLLIKPTHPTHHAVPVMQNPILEPLIPLAPYFPIHLGTPHLLWVNLARLARNPQSVFNRCRQVRNCGKTRPDASQQGCIIGSVGDTPAHVRFRIGGGMPHLLVTGWMAKQFRYPGTYVRLSRIRYRTFHLPSGRKIFLPVAFERTGILKPFGLWRGAFTDTVNISHISLNKPIPPGKFTINYELAHTIDEVAPNGKFHYITVHPTTRSAPGRDWNLNKHVPASH